MQSHVAHPSKSPSVGVHDLFSSIAVFGTTSLPGYNCTIIVNLLYFLGTLLSLTSMMCPILGSCRHSPPFRDNGLLSKNSHRRRVGPQVAAIHACLRRTDKFSTSQEVILREKFCVTESWDVRFSFGYRRSEF
ncbi:hypothetical protein T06_2940 [Trichinella sp. T6]|nr:hypothetical protein T06_2940 [Trichinella sp. T6]